MNIGPFMGRVGGDAVLKYTNSGKAVANFSLAMNNGKDHEGEKKAPTWIKVVLWEKKAEGLAPHITKGKFVIVSGTVDAEAWIDTKDGSAKSRIVVNCREFEFGGGGNREEDSAPARRAEPAARPYGNTGSSAEITDDDIPF